TVLRLLGDLAPEGRMARVLISIPDPLNIGSDSGQKPPLLIGEYVRIEIQGKSLSNIYRVPRNALRDNTHLWLLNGTNRLDVRAVETVWRSRDSVFIRDGLKHGEQLIVSGLSKPVPGMALKVQSQNDGIQSDPLRPDKQRKADESDTRQ
nr:hypothetical protein [Deltaproteobacteria bacterium]